MENFISRLGLTERQDTDHFEIIKHVFLYEDVVQSAVRIGVGGKISSSRHAKR